MGKILIVDDEKDLSLLIRQRYRKNIINGKYNFIFAMNGKEALDILDKYSDINLVITDLNMPYMNGLELIMYASPKYPNLDIMVMSAYSDNNAVRSAIKAGAVDFIFKPLNFNNFESIIEQYI